MMAGYWNCRRMGEADAEGHGGMIAVMELAMRMERTASHVLCEISR